MERMAVALEVFSGKLKKQREEDGKRKGQRQEASGAKISFKSIILNLHIIVLSTLHIPLYFHLIRPLRGQFPSSY